MAPYPIVIENINGKPQIHISCLENSYQKLLFYLLLFQLPHDESRIFSVSNIMLPSVIATDGNFPYIFRIAQINFLQAMFVLLLLIIKKRCLIDDNTIGHVICDAIFQCAPKFVRGYRNTL